MWTKAVSIKTSSSREQIWNLWTDVNNWKNWDNQVQDSRLDGDFTLGQKGALIPSGGPKSKFELVEVTPIRSFTTRSKLPFVIMDFVHTMEEINGELILTHRIQMTGLLTFLFSRLIGHKIIDHLPQALIQLDALAIKTI